MSCFHGCSYTFHLRFPWTSPFSSFPWYPLQWYGANNLGAQYIMNPCCHLSAIGTSNTSCINPWVVPFIWMSLMDCVSLGATSMFVVGANMIPSIWRYVIREKSQLLFNLPHFLYCIYQQHTPRCISYWMGFDANYCIIHILLYVLCCVLCSPHVYILQYCTHFSYILLHSRIDYLLEAFLFC